MSETPVRKTLHLHIGMHKTGTTALQNFFRKNDRILADHGIFYPKAGHDDAAPAHHDIANSIKGPPFPLLKPAKSADEYLAIIRAGFSSFSDILLSSEIFMRFVPAFKDHLSLNLSGLEKLAATADSVKVIIYLRRQDEYLESFYSQEVQHKLHKSFPDFIAARAPDYFRICHELAEAFGKHNVVVRVYDKNRFTGGSIFSDFLSIFDIGLTDQFHIPDRDVNPSWMPDEREFKRLINGLDLSLGEVMRFNRPLFERSEMSRREMGPDKVIPTLLSLVQRSEFLQGCASVNERVASEFLGRKGADITLFPDTSEGMAATSTVYPGLSQDVLLEIIRFINNSSPELITLLSNGVERSLESETPAARKSASLLRAALA